MPSAAWPSGVDVLSNRAVRANGAGILAPMAGSSTIVGMRSLAAGHRLVRDGTAGTVSTATSVPVASSPSTSESPGFVGGSGQSASGRTLPRARQEAPTAAVEAI